MCHFLTDLQIHNLNFSTDYVPSEQLDFLLSKSAVGTLSEVCFKYSISIKQTFLIQLLYRTLDICEFGGVKSNKFLDEIELSYLSEAYNVMYPLRNFCPNTIASAIQKYSQYKLGEVTYGSRDTRMKLSSYILASWCGRNGNIDNTVLRPAQVLHYFKHSVNVQGSIRCHIFAAVQWFKSYSSQSIREPGAMIFLKHFILTNSKNSLQICCCH